MSKFLGFYPSEEGIEKPYFDLESGEFTSNKKRLNIYIDEEKSSYLKRLLKNEKVSIPQEQKSILLKELLIYYKLHYYNLDTITSHLVIEKLRQ